MPSYSPPHPPRIYILAYCPMYTWYNVQLYTLLHVPTFLVYTWKSKGVERGAVENLGDYMCLSSSSLRSNDNKHGRGVRKKPICNWHGQPGKNKPACLWKLKSRRCPPLPRARSKNALRGAEEADPCCPYTWYVMLCVCVCVWLHRTCSSLGKACLHDSFIELPAF